MKIADDWKFSPFLKGYLTRLASERPEYAESVLAALDGVDLLEHQYCPKIEQKVVRAFQNVFWYNKQPDWIENNNRWPAMILDRMLSDVRDILAEAWNELLTLRPELQSKFNPIERDIAVQSREAIKELKKELIRASKQETKFSLLSRTYTIHSYEYIGRRVFDTTMGLKGFGNNLTF